MTGMGFAQRYEITLAHCCFEEKPGADLKDVSIFCNNKIFTYVPCSSKSYNLLSGDKLHYLAKSSRNRGCHR